MSFSLDFDDIKMLSMEDYCRKHEIKIESRAQIDQLHEEIRQSTGAPGWKQLKLDLLADEAANTDLSREAFCFQYSLTAEQLEYLEKRSGIKIEKREKNLPKTKFDEVLDDLLEELTQDRSMQKFKHTFKDSSGNYKIEYHNFEASEIALDKICCQL